MKTGHLVLYSNGYNATDAAHPDHHVWQAAVVTCTHGDWEPPVAGVPRSNDMPSGLVAPRQLTDIPQPAEGTVHVTVFEPNNAPFFATSVPRYKDGHAGQCWKPVE